MPPAPEPLREKRLLDMGIPLPILPVPEIGIAEYVSEECEHTLLTLHLPLAYGTHAGVLGPGSFTSRTRPVRSCCIMPCFIARVLSWRASSAAISASMSDKRVAMAVCSDRESTRLNSSHR